MLAVARVKSLLNERTGDIAKWFGLSTNAATTIKEIVRKYESRSVPKSSKANMALDAISDIIGGMGVEAVYPPGGWVAPLLLYVNMGDPYDITVCYDRQADKYFIGEWGDWVEDYENRGGEVY